MADALSNALNWIIPTILILIVIGWLYIKLLKPWVIPMLQKGWEWISQQSTTITTPTISYETPPPP